MLLWLISVLHHICHFLKTLTVLLLIRIVKVIISLTHSGDVFLLHLPLRCPLLLSGSRASAGRSLGGHLLHVLS